MKTLRDGYRGYIESGNFDLTDIVTTHRVNSRATLIFERADIKSQVIRRIVFGSELAATSPSSDGKYFELYGGGYVWASHCSSLGASFSSSIVDVGRQHFLEAPYLWGGRSPDGCDCSGLVQMLALACGIELPRDSGDQQAALNNDVELRQRQAEDLVFWPGHVGILETPDLLLHATAHSMRCCVEPLKQVIERAGEPVAVKRLG